MADIGYYRSCRRWRRIKGFRLSSGRLCVHRLRIRFLVLVRLLTRWKSAYFRALKSLKKGMSCRNRGNRSHVRGVAGEGGRYYRQDYKLRSYGRSNSFYAEAIAECLEFIKRSSSATADEDSETTTR
ncbi:hypothetical protein H6P81_001130 [Aristolochia fimbriata]|uniref:Uncharacterized protein n=1 Tax=Aristolochia fimbriata TaxID=158543 RepID=A0AAV7F652_ARIFI|nr:hypothetical protein H6P81_001130 [Aristolochia fimbriata]